jgi:hypothetical protein
MFPAVRMVERSKAPDSSFQTCSANAHPKGVLVRYYGRGFVKYLLFLRQVSKSIPKTYMSMDCCNCGIFVKIFAFNHAQIYAFLFSIERKL